MANRIVLKSTNPVTNISAAISTGAQGATGASGAGGATIADGDLGDIIVSGSGTVMTIDTSAVSATKLASNAVTTAKILDANVTAAKLASNAVTSANTDDTYEATLHAAANLTGTVPLANLSGSVLLVATYSGGTAVRPIAGSGYTVLWVCDDAADAAALALVSSGTAGRYANDIITTRA